MVRSSRWSHHVTDVDPVSTPTNVSVTQHTLSTETHYIHCQQTHTQHTLSTQTHNVQSSETHNVHCHPSSVCVVCHDCCTCFNRHKAKFAAGLSVVGLLSADNLVVWFAVCINQLVSVSYALKSATETEATEYQQCKLKLYKKFSDHHLSNYSS